MQVFRGMKNALLPSLLLWVLILFGASAAWAQSGGSTMRPTWFDGANQYYFSTDHPLPVTGANISTFLPAAAGARGTPLSVTTSDSSGSLPTGTVVAVSNVGANPMYCNVNGIAATTSDQYISSGGGWFAFTIPATIITLHCIATGGSTTANTVGGVGLPAGTGAGGSGGGGAITVADGADIAEGAKADAAYAGSGSSSVVSTLKGIYSVLAAALPAGENHVGEVGGNAFSITNDMTTTNATTTTGQSIGGLQTLANAVRVSGSVGASGTSGYVQTINVTFTDAVGAGPLDVYYFNASPSGSTCTNDSAFILANADRDKVIGIVHVTDFTASNTAAVAQANNQSMLYTVSAATSIFACVVARASFVITGITNASLVTRVVRN